MAWTERQRAMLAEMGLCLWGHVEAEARLDRPALTPAPSSPAPGLRPMAMGAVTRRDRGSSRLSDTLPPQPPAQGQTQVQEEGPRQAPGVAHMTWSALTEAVQTCRACSLCESRQQAVFGVGHPQAHVMVVGEAPGEQEDRQGEPFVGKSGRLLDNMLAAIGRTRATTDNAHQVFIANVLKCRPPMNRNPTPEEVRQCEAFLRRQVQLVQPRLILAMGRFAMESLLNTPLPVGKLRGRVHRYADVPVVVSYHPAYLLRQPQEKAKAWEDLCLAMAVLNAN